jgi:DNA-binding HxlR family transcriptional regulator
MATKRTYGEACAAAHALDLVGERWALLVVRELVLGPKRFTDLRAGIAHISPNVLGQRLRDLEEIGVVRRDKLPPPAASSVYGLTEWGLELEPILQELGRWGSRSPSHDLEAAMSIDSIILSFRTMFDGEAAGDLRATYELRFGEARFRVDVAGGEVDIVRGTVEDPDATIEADDPVDLVAVVYGGRPLAEAIEAGDVSVEGDKRSVSRFLSLFPLPDPVEPVEPLAVA